MPNHLHISTGFMFVVTFFVVGIIGLCLWYKAYKARLAQEERMAQREAERPVHVTQVVRETPTAGARSAEARPTSSDHAAPPSAWGTSGYYTRPNYAPAAPVAPVAAVSPVIVAGGNSNAMGDAFMGSMMGSMIGSSLGGHHTSVVHDTTVVHDSYAPSYSAPADSGFSCDSGPSCDSGFDISWGSDD